MRTDLIDQRKSKGLDQAALAKKIGLDQTSVSRIENGKQAIKPEVARKMARALGMDVLSILFPKA